MGTSRDGMDYWRFFFILLHFAISYLTDLLSLTCVGAAGTRINVRSSYSHQRPAVAWLSNPGWRLLWTSEGYYKRVMVIMNVRRWCGRVVIMNEQRLYERGEVVWMREGYYESAEVIWTSRDYVNWWNYHNLVYCYLDVDELKELKGFFIAPCFTRDILFRELRCCKPLYLI